MVEWDITSHTHTHTHTLTHSLSLSLSLFHLNLNFLSIEMVGGVFKVKSGTGLRVLEFSVLLKPVNFDHLRINLRFDREASLLL